MTPVATATMTMTMNTSQMMKKIMILKMKVMEK
jgi:hypothetical protein